MVSTEKHEEEGEGTLSYSDEKPVSNKQRSSISSTRQNKKSKTGATHTQVRSVDLFCFDANQQRAV